MARDEEDLANIHAPGLGARRWQSECFGTFLLVTVDGGGAVVARASGGEVTPEARSLATGLVVMALIYAVGDVSGAHFNPAVTFAFAVRRVFPWSKVPLYWSAQVAGALVAALLLRAVFGNVADLGVTKPNMGVGRALVMEILLTAILASVIIGTATRHQSVGPNAAIASGGTVALCGLFARPVSGASMNPARSLGPAVVSGALDDVWIYLVGPLVGAALATAIMRAVHPRKHEEEQTAAEGEKK